MVVARHTGSLNFSITISQDSQPHQHFMEGDGDFDLGLYLALPN